MWLCGCWSLLSICESSGAKASSSAPRGLGVSRSAWDGTAESLRCRDSVWIGHSLMLHIWVHNFSTLVGGSRSFTGQPFKNEWAVSTVFHFQEQAGRPTGRMHGAQRAKQIQRRPGGASGKDWGLWWLELCVSSSLGFFASSRKPCCTWTRWRPGTVFAALWGSCSCWRTLSSLTGSSETKLNLLPCLWNYLSSRKWLKGGSGVFSFCCRVEALVSSQNTLMHLFFFNLFFYY